MDVVCILHTGKLLKLNRVMGNNSLIMLIIHNEYLLGIALHCNNASELRHEILKTTCLSTICLIDIDWCEVYYTIKGEYKYI